MLRVPRVAALWILVALCPAMAQTVRSSGATVDRVLSPRVVANWLSHPDKSGELQLDLLVLWRGSPGWFAAAGGGGGGGMMSQGRGASALQSLRVHYGDVDLELAVHPERVAVFQDGEISLGAANVILIDTVDTSPQVVGTTQVDPTIPDSGRIEFVLRRSPELVEYLDCEARVADPSLQEQTEFLCAQVLGRCDARLANPTLQAMLEASCVP
jgi:hypothetical protein